MTVRHASHSEVGHSYTHARRDGENALKKQRKEAPGRRFLSSARSRVPLAVTDTRPQPAAKPTSPSQAVRPSVPAAPDVHGGRSEAPPEPPGPLAARRAARRRHTVLVAGGWWWAPPLRRPRRWGLTSAASPASSWAVAGTRPLAPPRRALPRPRLRQWVRPATWFIAEQRSGIQQQTDKSIASMCYVFQV